MSYDKISLGKLRFWIHMQDAVYSLQQFGEATRAIPYLWVAVSCRCKSRWSTQTPLPLNLVVQVLSCNFNQRVASIMSPC